MSVPTSPGNFINRPLNKLEESVIGPKEVAKGVTKAATQSMNKARDQAVQNSPVRDEAVQGSPVKEKSNIDKMKSMSLKGGKVLLSFNLAVQSTLLLRTVTRAAYGTLKTYENSEVAKEMDKAGALKETEAFRDAVWNSEIQIAHASERPAQVVSLAPVSRALSEADKMANKSAHIRKEITDTERTHMENLERGIAGINALIAMSDQKVISTPKGKIDLEQAKVNFEMAIASSTKLLVKLEKAEEKYDLENPSTSLDANREFARAYSEEMEAYAENILSLAEHQEILNAMNGELRVALENPEKEIVFLKYMDESTSEKFDPNTRQKTINEFDTGFITAVQRMPRHVLLLNDLKDNTPDNEQQDLKESARLVKLKSLVINNTLKINDLQESLNGLLAIAASPKSETSGLLLQLERFLSQTDALVNPRTDGEIDDSKKIDTYNLQKISDMLNALKNEPTLSQLLESNPDLNARLMALEESIGK